MASTASLSPLTTCRTPSGRPGLLHQLGEHQRHRGVALGRLEDEGVAAGERRAHLPHRDHRREVERGDPGDDAERLAHRVHVDAGAGGVGELALQQVRRADAELGDLEAALHVALGVGQGLAVLAR